MKSIYKHLDTKYAIACNSRYINAFKKMDPELP